MHNASIEYRWTLKVVKIAGLLYLVDAILNLREIKYEFNIPNYYISAIFSTSLY